MRIGLIGFGSIGRRHYENIKKYTKNIVILSSRKDLKNMPIVHNWQNFTDLGTYEAIFIFNEPFKHVSTIKKCISINPQAIFVEKPLSHNSKDLLALSKILKKKNISLFVGYNFHFLKSLQEIRKIIQSKKLGKIYYMRVSVGQDLREWRSRDYRLNYAAKKERGGGVMLDLVHEINYAGWLLGELLISKTSVIKKISNLEIDTEDCADSIFISKKGTIVSVHQDYLRIPLKRSLDIVGEKGSLEWDHSSNIMKVQFKEKTIKKKLVSKRNEMFSEELKFFFSSVKKKKFFTNIEEAIRDITNVEYLKKHAKN